MECPSRRVPVELHTEKVREVALILYAPSIGQLGDEVVVKGVGIVLVIKDAEIIYVAPKMKGLLTGASWRLHRTVRVRVKTHVSA